MSGSHRRVMANKKSAKRARSEDLDDGDSDDDYDVDARTALDTTARKKTKPNCASTGLGNGPVGADLTTEATAIDPLEILNESEAEEDELDFDGAMDFSGIDVTDNSEYEALAREFYGDANPDKDANLVSTETLNAFVNALVDEEGNELSSSEELSTENPRSKKPRARVKTKTQPMIRMAFLTKTRLVLEGTGEKAPLGSNKGDMINENQVVSYNLYYKRRPVDARTGEPLLNNPKINGIDR